MKYGHTVNARKAGPFRTALSFIFICALFGIGIYSPPAAAQTGAALGPGATRDKQLETPSRREKRTTQQT